MRHILRNVLPFLILFFGPKFAMGQPNSSLKKSGTSLKTKWGKFPAKAGPDNNQTLHQPLVAIGEPKASNQTKKPYYIALN